MVADIEELLQNSHARSFDAKEVLSPMRGGNFIFPVADGTVTIFWRRSACENTHVNPGLLQTEQKSKKFFEENQADICGASPHQDESTPR